MYALFRTCSRVEPSSSHKSFIFNDSSRSRHSSGTEFEWNRSIPRRSPLFGWKMLKVLKSFLLRGLRSAGKVLNPFSNLSIFPRPLKALFFNASSPPHGARCSRCSCFCARMALRPKKSIFPPSAFPARRIPFFFRESLFSCPRASAHFFEDIITHAICLHNSLIHGHSRPFADICGHRPIFLNSSGSC